MSKTRLDQEMIGRGLVASRSQAASYIKLGLVLVNKAAVTKPGFLVGDTDSIKLTAQQQYVSRAGLKLASVAKVLGVDFNGSVVLDVGSSTGGFTEFALLNGAKKVIAVEVGKDQMHPTLRQNPKIELHEKTDIRDFTPTEHIDIVVMDVSFISLRQILPHIAKITDTTTQIVAMLKPQFEAENSGLKHKGVIKNDSMRRGILKDFEAWAQKLFVIMDKADSDVSGAKGNKERFYLLKNLK